MKTTMNTPTTRATFCLTVLLGLGLLMPWIAVADTFTFSTSNNGSGTGIEDLSIGLTNVSFQTLDSPLTAELKLLETEGKVIPSIFINDFQVLNNVPTLAQTFEFDHDVITSVQIVVNGGDRPVTDVTFAYETMEVLTPTATPEPSSLLLLGAGSLGGLGVMRRKLRC